MVDDHCQHRDLIRDYRGRVLKKSLSDNRLELFWVAAKVKRASREASHQDPVDRPLEDRWQKTSGPSLGSSEYLQPLQSRR
ncbi:hypothetical protein [Diaphorobacter sp.]|uniref:hypothetical protein n=1 Tax=Diaphorobacter sp. TaxID=1934310 RepID=UPI002587EA74|nr:hypothetical protein [Diaphorobacter sp.]